MLRSSTDMLNLLVNPFDWDKEFYRFNRWEKDMNPYSIKYDDEKHQAILSHNVLGINKEDLSISIKKENGRTYLVISGKTKDEITEKEYAINSRFALDEDSYDTDKIDATIKNGLVYITIPYKLEVKKDNTKTIEIK